MEVILWLVDYGELDGNGNDLCVFRVQEDVVQQYTSSRGWVYPMYPGGPLKLSVLIKYHPGPLLLQKIDQPRYEMFTALWKKS